MVTQSPDKYGRWLPFLLSILITVAGIGSTIGVYGEKLQTAKSERDEFKEMHKSYVTKEILELTMEPVKQDIEYTKEAIKRVEKTNWQILEHLKAMNGGAHTQ